MAIFFYGFGKESKGVLLYQKHRVGEYLDYYEIPEGTTEIAKCFFSIRIKTLDEVRVSQKSKRQNYLILASCNKYHSVSDCMAFDSFCKIPK